MKSTARYAVYWVPTRSDPLWSAGCAWLGRDPEDAGRSMSTRPATREPCRYGFHATLKAPMHLHDDAHASAFLEAAHAIAATTRPFAMPALEVAQLAQFIALRPVDAIGADHPLQRLAGRCVTELDAFRAPFDRREWEARSAGLDADARERLRQHGYPHVLAHWRFHMTLSDSFAVGASIDPAMRDEAARHFESALRLPIIASEIGVFIERSRGGPLRLEHRIRLEG